VGRCACRGQQACDGLVRHEPVPPGHRVARLRLQGGELNSVGLRPRVTQQRGRALLQLRELLEQAAVGKLRGREQATGLRLQCRDLGVQAAQRAPIRGRQLRGR